MTDRHSAACPCGAVAVEAQGEPVDLAACPCPSCRRGARGAFAPLALWPEGAVLVTRGADRLAGPPARQCCALCRTHVLSRHDGLAAIGAALLPDAAARVPPRHLHPEAASLPTRKPRPGRRAA